MKVSRKDVSDAVFGVLEGGFRSATVFCGSLKEPVPLRVRATIRLFKGKEERNKREVLITIGKPNAAEREHLRHCKRAKCLPRRTWYAGRRK